MRHIHLLVTLGLFLIGSVGSLNAEVLLDIKSFKLSKKYPAEFQFNLKEGDNFILSFSKVSGNLDPSQVDIQVIDLNNIEEEILGDFRIPAGSVRIPSDGIYVVRFTYKGKDLSLQGRRFGNFSFRAESLQTEDLKPGEFRNILQATSLAIDDDIDNAMKIILDVEAGDRISFSSADPKSSIVKINIQQLGRTAFVNTMSGIIVPKDNKLTVSIFLADNDDPINLYNVRELLSNDDLLFTDLVIDIERKQSNIMGGGDLYNSTVPLQEESTTDEIDPYSSIIEQMQAQQAAGSQNYQAMLEDMQNNQNLSAESQSKLLEILLESTKEKEYVEVYTQEMKEIEVNLGPEGNLFKKNKNSTPENRSCTELLLRGANYNKWFYWIAVGEEAKETFELESEKFSKQNGRRKELIQAKGEYYYYMGDSENARLNPPLPNLRNYSNYFTEDVEYAVVDAVNKDKFLKGLPYRQENISRSKFVFVDSGWAISPPNAEVIYHVCFRNNNQRTPIKVVFKYFTIDTEKSLR